MKTIVVLDAHTLNPLPVGESSPIHPSWEPLAALGKLTIHPRTPPARVPEVAANAEILLTNKVPITAETLAALPKLEYIGVMATGTNIVDLQAAKARGIPVTNVPGYSTMSVVQTVFSLLFELAGRIGDTANEVRNGKWAACPDFSFTIAPYYELSGRTLGIVGYGTIGAAVASVAHALGMKILVNSRSQKDSPTPIQWVPLPDLLAQADIITLHCPLTLDTQGLINSNTLATMKPGAFLINTGRGPLIDEAAVADALHSGHLGGFAADVLTNEPPEESNPLLSAPRTVITPHIAWASVEARHRLMDGIVENLRAHLTGKSQNVVYP